ncbi:MAG: hypothetical protein PHU81_00610 [Acidobacteriota bacterium]|nr:hypothetical protein [Acidobacteriota bacterium]
MKKSILLVALALFLSVSCLIYVPPEERPSSHPYETSSYYGQPVAPEITFGYIYNYLDGFGFWINYSPFGYVWVPKGVGARWHPYIHGYWAWTDYGWTWVSAYKWGWLPFHYGRWGRDARLGWFWVPDVDWAPAWVIWRYNDIYLGWAPVPPDIPFRPGYGFDWRNKNIHYELWVFVEGRHFHDRHLANWVLPPERNRTIINSTVIGDRVRIKNNVIVNDGLSPQQVERVTGRPVNSVKLREIKQPDEEKVSQNEVRIYRPVIKKESVTPGRVMSGEEIEQKVTPDRLSYDTDSLNSYHQREQVLLERTQKKEIDKLKKEADKEIKTASPQEKQKKLDDLQQKVEQLKQQHQEEKQQLLQRQEKEKKTINPESLRQKDT